MNLVKSIADWAGVPDRTSGAREAVPPRPATLYWGMRHLHFSDAAQRFLVVGSPGSGKTTVLELLMRSVFPQLVRPGSNHRALIYDAKRDTLPLLAGMGLTIEGTKDAPPEVRTLNPFDARGFAWDLGRDIDSPATALQIATILIPAESHSNNPFFTDAARLLLYGVMVGLLDRKNWSLRDLLMICRDLPRLKDMLLRSPYTADFVPLLLSVEKQSATIMTTLATKLLPFETVAALWDRALAEGRVVSLNDWVKSNFILVLGTHPANRAALQTLNQVIFRRVADLLLTQAEEKDHGVTGRKTWLILDEVREAGKLDGLTSLLNQGRSKAVCMVLGFQDVEGMRHVYGKEEAHEIFGMCDNKTMLRTESQPTAEWVEKHFGQALVSEITTSQSESTSGEYTSSENVQEHIQLRSTVLAAEIMGLPKTNPQNGMTAYHDIPQFGPYKATLPWSTITDLRRQMIPGRLAPTGEILGEMPRSVQDQYLRPWGEADAKLLAKPVATEVSTPASEEKRILSALSLSPDSPTTNPPE